MDQMDEIHRLRTLLRQKDSNYNDLALTVAEYSDDWSSMYKTLIYIKNSGASEDVVKLATHCLESLKRA